MLEYKEHKFNDDDPVSEDLFSFNSDKYGILEIDIKCTKIFLMLYTNFKYL